MQKYQARREEMYAATGDRKVVYCRLWLNSMIHGAKICSAQPFKPPIGRPKSETWVLVMQDTSQAQQLHLNARLHKSIEVV